MNCEDDFDTALASEAVLARAWLTDEEDAAWASLEDDPVEPDPSRTSPTS